MPQFWYSISHSLDLYFRRILNCIALPKHNRIKYQEPSFSLIPALIVKETLKPGNKSINDGIVVEDKDWREGDLELLKK